MSITRTYTELVKGIEPIINANPTNPIKATAAVVGYIQDKNLDFEELETLSLSTHYLREFAPVRKPEETVGSDIHVLISQGARSALTERYYSEKDRKWESPCVGFRRLDADRLNQLTDYRVLYELTMTSIGHGVNQALFGVFRNFRDPAREMEAVMEMISNGTICKCIDLQFDVIRDFICGAMFYDHDSRELQARGNYALGLLKMFREELKNYAGTVLQTKLQYVEPHEAERLTGGLFRLIRRNTRELRCELSFLAIKAADMNNQYIQSIAQHAKENALEMVAHKTLRKTASPTLQ